MIKYSVNLGCSMTSEIRSSSCMGSSPLTGAVDNDEAVVIFFIWHVLSVRHHDPLLPPTLFHMPPLWRHLSLQPCPDETCPRPGALAGCAQCRCVMVREISKSSGGPSPDRSTVTRGLPETEPCLSGFLRLYSGVWKCHFIQLRVTASSQTLSRQDLRDGLQILQEQLWARALVSRDDTKRDHLVCVVGLFPPQRERINESQERSVLWVQWECLLRKGLSGCLLRGECSRRAMMEISTQISTPGKTSLPFHLLAQRRGPY